MDETSTPMELARASASSWSMRFEAILTDQDIKTLAVALIHVRLAELVEATALFCERCGDPDGCCAAVWVPDYNTWRHPEHEGVDLKWPCGAALLQDRIAALRKSLT